MINEERLQELRKRKAYRREAELEDMEKKVGEVVSPTENKLKSKRGRRPLTQAVKVGRKSQQLFSTSKDRHKVSKKKMKETLFIDEWHDTCDVLPDCGEDVWFIFDGQIKVGIYEPMQRVFCMADGFGAELRDVRQWKYVGVNKQYMKYPKEKQIIACSVVGYPCLVTGIFTDHCVDENTYDEVSAVILDEDYSGIDKVVDWKRVSYWFELTEEPFVILDPVEDSVLAVFPDSQTIITDDTGVILDPPESCCEDNCIETPYTVPDTTIEDDFESAENKNVNSNITPMNVSEDDLETTDVVENTTTEDIGTSQIAKAMHNRDDEVKLSLQAEKIKKCVSTGKYTKKVNSTVEDALKAYTSGDSTIKTQAGKGVQKGEETVEKAIDTYTSKKESKTMDKIYKVTEAQMDIITDYNLQGNVKDWYTKEYPTDDLGKEIDPSVTFQDVFDCLDCHEDIYSCLDVYDSVVRERVFDKLAELIDADYDYVYDQWLTTDSNKPFVRDNSRINIERVDEDDVTEDKLNKLAKMFGLESEFEKINKESEEKKTKTLAYVDEIFKNFENNLKDALNTETETTESDEDLDECVKKKAKDLKESVNLKDYNLESLPKELQESLVSYLVK